MQDNVFQQVLKWEQETGLTNDPLDKGGVTNDGITWEHYYLLCQKILGVAPSLDGFQKLTVEEVKAFYLSSYEQINCDKIDNQIVAAVCFDFAKNSQFGKREIQRCLKNLGYQLNADNIFGKITIKTLNDATRHIGALVLVNRILDRRVAYVNQIVRRDSTQKKFLKGWLNRIADWRNFAEMQLSEK